MSQIDKLLQEHCPNGVPYRNLEEITDLRAGDRVVKSNMVLAGQFPVIGGGTSPTGFLNESNMENSVTIARAGSAGHVNFVAGRFWATDVCFVASQIPEGPEIKFVYFYLKSRQSELMAKIYGGSMPKLDKKFLFHLPIPVPPIEIQNAIVGVLETFVELETNLQAELDARKKQFDHYQKLLMDFSGSKIEWIDLGQAGSVKMCKRIFANQTEPQGDIPFYKIGTFGKSADAFISRDLFEDYKNRFNFPRVGEVLLSASGTIGRTVVFDGKDAYFQDSNIIWLEHDENIISNAFLKHWYKIVPWVTEGGTIQRLYNKNLLSVKFPRIPLDQQNKIAYILDQFDELIDGRSSGISAELRARLKQYEHYGAKLLTFKELAS